MFAVDVTFSGSTGLKFFLKKFNNVCCGIEKPLLKRKNSRKAKNNPVSFCPTRIKSFSSLCSSLLGARSLLHWCADDTLSPSCWNATRWLLLAKWPPQSHPDCFVSSYAATQVGDVTGSQNVKRCRESEACRSVISGPIIVEVNRNCCDWCWGEADRKVRLVKAVHLSLGRIPRDGSAQKSVRNSRRLSSRWRVSICAFSPRSNAPFQRTHGCFVTCTKAEKRCSLWKKKDVQRRITTMD